MFLRSPCGRRLVLHIRRTAAAAAGSTNLLQRHAPRLPDHYSSSSSSTSLATTPDPDTVSYLVASCGLSPAAAAAAASRGRGRRIRSTARADEVLSLLRHCGFSDAEIAQLLAKLPELLLYDPDKIVGPKLKFFAALGMRTAVLARTNLLKHSLDKYIVPYFEFLLGILGTEASTIRSVFSRNPFNLGVSVEKYGRPAVEALRRHGLTNEDISNLLIKEPAVLRMAPDRIAGIFEDLEALGLPITDFRFIRCFAVLCGIKRGDTMWRRLALYESAGLSQSQVASAFMSLPQILGLTDECIQRKLLFFQDELKIPLHQVIAQPRILTLSVDKNILPKCAVLSVLMREGKIQRDVNLLARLGASFKRFSRRYVKKFEKDVPDVVRAYEGKIKFEGFMDQGIEIS